MFLLVKIKKTWHNLCMIKKEKVENFFSILKNKILDIRHNKTVLVCCLLSIIYLLSGYWKWLEIGVSLTALVFMAILPLQSSFCIFMFLHSFTLSTIGHDSCFMVTMIGYCLILLVKYINGVEKGKYVYHKKLVSTILIFYTVGTALSLFNPLYRGAWLYFVYLPLFYLIFAMRKEFSISQGMNYMFGGLLTSCSLALISLLFPGFQYNVLFGLTGTIKEDRFNAFINNPNYLSMRALFILSYYMYQFCLNKLSTIRFGSIFVILSLITLATKSKAGFVALAIITILFVIFYLKQDFKKRIKVVGIFALLIIAVCLVGYTYLIQLIDRFLISYNGDSLLSTFLTGRDEIWGLYLDKIYSSPFKFLFGHGLLHEQIYIASQFGPTETHNFYIFLLYRFGIVGIIALGYIIYLFIKLLNKDKPKAVAYLPLIYILLVSFIDNTMKCYNITYFLFAIMIMFMNCAEKPENKDASSKRNKKLRE